MRVLIYGTSYVGDEGRQWLVEQWAKVNRQINPDCDLIIVDSASPLPLPEGVYAHQLCSNLGHLGSTGVDGWGRAFTTGLEIAVEKGYDFVFLIDTDILFFQPVMSIAFSMAADGQVYGTCEGPPYDWPEGGLVFCSVPWLQATNFPARYDWQNVRPGTFPERRLAELAGSKLTTLPLRGRRNDDGLVRPDNIGELFPNGLDWITHCTDFEVYREALRLNGIS